MASPGVTLRSESQPTWRPLALDGQHRYAGLALAALRDGDQAPALVEYVEALPSWIVEVWGAASVPRLVEVSDEKTGKVTRTTTWHVWAPCSECGEGIFVEAPPVPQTPREALKDSDGPLCRLTWTTETIGTLTTTVRCRGRHYPLEGPWLASHPLGRELVPAPAW